MQRGSLDQIVSLGMGQFVWRYGVVCFGCLYFLATAVTRWVGIDPALRYDWTVVASLAVISLVYSFSLGAVAGFVGWFLISVLARRHKKRAVTADDSVIASVRKLAVADLPDNFPDVDDLPAEAVLASSQAAGTNN